MSINLLLDNNKPAETYKKFRFNSLTIDDELLLPKAPQLSAALNNNSFVFPSENIQGSWLNYNTASDILPHKILFGTDYINIDTPGVYSVNIQLCLQISVYSVGSTFTLQFFDDTNNIVEAENQIYINHDKPFFISINRVMQLQTGKNYAIILNQSVNPQTTLLLGSSNRSFFAMCKLL